MNKKMIILFLWFFTLSAMENSTSKGEKLCYDEKIFLATNNSAATYGPSWPTLWSVDAHCQNFSIEKQLQKGARGLVLLIGKVKDDDVYVFNGPGQSDLSNILPQKIDEWLPFLKIFFADSHASYFDPATTTLKQVLGMVKTFMDDNPQETLTLFLQDQTRKHTEISKSFDAVGLKKYLYIKEYENKWPDLEQMKKKLVVFINTKAEDSPGWMHNFDDFFSTVDVKLNEEGSVESTQKDSWPPKLCLLRYVIEPTNNGRSPWNPYCIGGKEEDAERIRFDLAKHLDLIKPNFVTVNFMNGQEADTLNQLNSKN